MHPLLSVPDGGFDLTACMVDVLQAPASHHDDFLIVIDWSLELWARIDPFSFSYADLVRDFY